MDSGHRRRICVGGGVNNFDSSLVDAWIFSGYNNSEAPGAITGVNGTELKCMNFAWTEQSGFDGQGFLVFDGVDDYLVNENMELLDDFTVIVDRTALEKRANCTASKSANVGKGAFIMEIRDSGSNDYSFYSFNGYNNCTARGEGTAWMTATSYNGQAIARGQAEDTTMLCVGNVRKTETSGRLFKGGMKFFALYRRSLSQEEITAEIGKLTSLWESRKV